MLHHESFQMMGAMRSLLQKSRHQGFQSGELQECVEEKYGSTFQLEDNGVISIMHNPRSSSGHSSANPTTDESSQPSSQSYESAPTWNHLSPIDNESKETDDCLLLHNLSSEELLIIDKCVASSVICATSNGNTACHSGCQEELSRGSTYPLQENWLKRQSSVPKSVQQDKYEILDDGGQRSAQRTPPHQQQKKYQLLDNGMQRSGDHHHVLLHRSASEPFSRPVRLHRTQSLIAKVTMKPLTHQQLLSGLEDSLPGVHPEGHMLPSHILGKDKQATAPLESGEHGANHSQVVSIAKESDLSEADDSWVTTSCSDEEYPVLDDYTPIHRLLRHLEYMTNTVRKRMDATLFTYCKERICNKILDPAEVQYGYQHGRYIKIGHGEFGDVLYGRLMTNLQLVAIKALRRDKTDTFALLQEAFMLQIASQTGYTPKFWGLAPINILGSRYQDWGIILEFVGDANYVKPYDFRQTLLEAQNMAFTPQLVLQWIYISAKITHATKRFHHMGLLLNDIKADNILLRPTCQGMEPVFIDFGLASIGEGITLALEVTESNKAKLLKEYSHIAPEVLFGGETNTLSDIFSLGKALSLISDAFPIDAFSNIVQRCTNWEPSERPTCNELLQCFELISESIINS